MFEFLVVSVRGARVGPGRYDNVLNDTIYLIVVQSPDPPEGCARRCLVSYVLYLLKTTHLWYTLENGQ